MLNETETPIPGSVLTPSQVRKLKIAIAIMSALFVIGFILLLVGIYQQARKLSKKPETPATLTIPAGLAATINLPVKSGAEISQVLTEPGRLILLIKQAGGNEIAIIDMATGQEVQRIRLAPQKSP
jgi:hypothetical protein